MFCSDFNKSRKACAGGGEQSLIIRDTKEEFLNIMENWIKEIVAKNADGDNEQIPSIIKERFHLSMQANEEYHRNLANALSKDDDDYDRPMVNYHFLMSEIYKKLCRE